MTQPSPTANETTPCAIIGAGVAGHAAAVWLASYGVDFVWLGEGGEVGGMLHRVYNKLVNVPGEDFDSGVELARRIGAQVDASKLSPPRAARVKQITKRDDGAFDVALDDSTSLIAEKVILATGTRYRELALPGADDTSLVTNEDSAFIRHSASRDAEKFAGKRVGVIGGGDAAFENALILAKHGCEVHLFMRSAPRARRKFFERVIRADAIRLWPIPTTITCANERDGALHVSLDTPAETEALELDGLFVRIGVEPVLPTCAPALMLDPAGHVIVDEHARTSTPGLFAAGDIIAHPLQAIVASAAEGARAALTVAEELGVFNVSVEEVLAHASMA